MNPILPATNETAWSVITIAFAVLVMLAYVLLIRWASFKRGSQIGRLTYRGPKHPLGRAQSFSDVEVAGV